MRPYPSRWFIRVRLTSVRDANSSFPPSKPRRRRRRRSSSGARGTTTTTTTMRNKRLRIPIYSTRDLRVACAPRTSGSKLLGDRGAVIRFDVVVIRAEASRRLGEGRTYCAFAPTFFFLKTNFLKFVFYLKKIKYKFIHLTNADVPNRFWSNVECGSWT